MLYVLNIIVQYPLIYVGTKDRQFLTFIHSFIHSTYYFMSIIQTLLHSFLYKNVVFPAQAEYFYFLADFRLEIFLYYS